MRIPYPERIPLNGAVYFALALFLIQVLEGTALYFSVGCALFILLATVTFNTAGGLTRASGAYVFFYSMLVVIVGLCYKAYLGEPAQTNLADPHTDIEAYVGSMAAMYVAVVVSRRFSRKRGLLQGILKERDMYRASVGCMLFGALAGFGIALLGSSGTLLQSGFSQLNRLIPLGVIIGVMYEIRSSGGTRSSNLFTALGIAYAFFFGVVGFSKEGLISPFVCWLIPVWALRYRLSAIQIAACCLFIFISFYYLVPYSQYGRSLVPEDATLSQRAAIGYKLLQHPGETRRIYRQGEEDADYLGNKGLGSYYNSSQGFWDRLQFVSVDDALINITDEGHIFGLLPVELSLANTVPHFLWPNKPSMNLGNRYAHEINGEAEGEGDTTTGISFSPTAEAYHLEKWAGIFFLAPIVWVILFTIYDTLFGDVRATPWGLLVVVMMAHAAPEGGITYCIYLCSFGVESLLFCAFFAAWFAPVLSVGILGPEKSRTLLPRSVTIAPTDSI